MHDFTLANQIIKEIQKVAKEKGIDKIKKVSLEIGSVALAHDGMPEHIDDIDPGNIKFLLEKLAQNNGLGKVKFNIKKVFSNSWKILEIQI